VTKKYTKQVNLMINLETFYIEYKPLISSVAYRLLGSVSDAEDVVQDIIIKCRSIDFEQINHIKTYLVKITTNHCLNILKSKQKKKEYYPGEWLPEPQIENATKNKPLSNILQKEEISYALLCLLENLTPIERAVFVLRDTFGYEYQDIAEILNKTEVNCRKIYSRSKRKIPNDMQIYSQETPDSKKIIDSFIFGAKTGDFDQFIQLLISDASLVTDGGGKVKTAIFPIRGKDRIQIFLEAIEPRGFYQAEMIPAFINGQKGIVMKKNGMIIKTICFDWDMDQKLIRNIYIMLNQDKLDHLNFN
jgi:RNA polymerase sigma-70 factor, ECF subfamily